MHLLFWPLFFTFYNHYSSSIWMTFCFGWIYSVKVNSNDAAPVMMSAGEPVYERLHRADWFPSGHVASL